MTSLFERPFLITKMNLTSVSYKAFLIKGNACTHYVFHVRL